MEERLIHSALVCKKPKAKAPACRIGAVVLLQALTHSTRRAAVAAEEYMMVREGALLRPTTDMLGKMGRLSPNPETPKA